MKGDIVAKLFIDVLQKGMPPPGCGNDVCPSLMREVLESHESLRELLTEAVALLREAEWDVSAHVGVPQDSRNAIGPTEWRSREGVLLREARAKLEGESP